MLNTGKYNWAEIGHQVDDKTKLYTEVYVLTLEVKDNLG